MLATVALKATLLGLLLLLLLPRVPGSEIMEQFRYNRVLYDRIQRLRVINLSNSKTCGGRVIQAKIVGGSSVKRGEFPFLVSIKSKGVHFCGGSIISEWYILTAAHCLIQRDLDDLSVTVREFDMSRGETEFHAYDILPTKVVIHSKFVLKTYDNDIALIRLAKPIQWDRFTQPVCLPGRSKKRLAGKTGILVGWGRISEEGVRSSFPLKLEVPLVTMEECENVLGRKNVNPTKFCAGFLQGGRDACQGDSGGPLVLQMGKVYVQEGIISSGVGCARADLYGLYTRMSEFLPWLRTAMNKTALSPDDLHFNMSDIYVSALPSHAVKGDDDDEEEEPDNGSLSDALEQVQIIWSSKSSSSDVKGKPSTNIFQILITACLASMFTRGFISQR